MIYVAINTNNYTGTSLEHVFGVLRYKETATATKEATKLWGAYTCKTGNLDK